MVSRSTFHEQSSRLWSVAQRPSRLPEIGRPSNHAERMQVALPVYICSSIEECADSLIVAVCGGPVERVGVIAGFSCVRIGAVREKQPNNFGVASFGRLMQPRPTR